MTEIKSPENLFRCECGDTDPLPFYQAHSPPFAPHQSQPNHESQYFHAKSDSPDSHEITEKRRLLNHLTQRLIRSKLPGADYAIDYLLHK